MCANSTGADQTSYLVTLPNGSYSYTIQTLNKVYSPSYTNSFTVNGNHVPETIAFSKVTYVVKFTESGLPSGTSWSVTFNGTYFYSIGSASGYMVSPPSANITVNGKNVRQSITSSASSKISSTELNAMIGAVAAVAVIWSAIAVMRRK